LLLFYALLPCLLFCFPAFMQHIFFLNFVLQNSYFTCPIIFVRNTDFFEKSVQFWLISVKVPFRDYNNPNSFGVHSLGRNFYVESRDGIHLGCWHILPASLSEKLSDHKQPLSAEQFEQTLSAHTYPVMIYLHGNSFDRTAGHRIDLYNVLSTMEFHVIALDYRGYGDSTGFPTEIGVVQDAKQIYRYVKRLAGDNEILIWGHSMGTGVASAAVMELSETGGAPFGLILESPFNNLHDVIISHPFAAPFRWLPWFDDIVVHPLENSGLNMSSDLRITRVSCPILIMHAEDDHVIPSKLGRRLRDAAVVARRDVTYVEFEASRQYRHKYIYAAPELPSIIT
uniref:Lysophosphatidylserine lipase ABHD12 n=1 Tax=Anisakis simplex TaxID=6269 RepID=A0A0M3K415_ANISI